jgi:4-hydroxybenzoate polyprenyltransferase
MRPWQWYKNLLIFLPLIFAGELFNQPAHLRVILGFAALCMISSANYILNDIIDKKKDRMHPEKKNRPLASGKANVFAAVIFGTALAVFSVWIAFYLGNYFVYFVAGLFALTFVYSYAAKQLAFVDITIIGVNFIIRAVSGAFVIFPDKIVRISPWLVLCPFFLALFLATGKRLADIKLLGSKAHLHKPILKFYTKDVTQALMTINTTALLICIALYSFNSDFTNLIYTLPLPAFIMFRYIYLVESGSEIARHAHLLFRDVQIMIAGFLWAAVSLAIIYVF